MIKYESIALKQPIQVKSEILISENMVHNNCISITRPEIIPKVSEVLDLILKKKHGRGSQDRHSFTAVHSYTLKNCTSLVNECLLSHRFEEAAKLLCIMWKDRTSFDMVLFKGIMVVLENLISSDQIESVKKISSNIRKLKYMNKLDVQLEYLIYALKTNVYGEEDSFYLEGKRARKRRIKKIPLIEQIYSAYCGLINYITWVNITQGEESCHDDKDIAFATIAAFKQLIENPGIWDIFILKLTEMLEYYGHYGEIEEVLKKYVAHNPEHINAYIYLCIHLHKHKADAKTFIHYAEILANLCPSDERVLLLVQKWNELGKYLKKRLKILFMFLDYSSNRNRILGWHLLSSHLQEALSSKKPSSMKTVNSFWKLRHSSWSYMHFKPSDICTEKTEVIAYKVQALSVLKPDHEYIKEALKRIPSISSKHLEQNEALHSMSEDFSSLYSLNDNV